MTDSNYHNQISSHTHRKLNRSLISNLTYGGIADFKLENTTRYYYVKWIGPSGPQYIWMASYELTSFEEDIKAFHNGVMSNSLPSSSTHIPYTTCQPNISHNQSGAFSRASLSQLSRQPNILPQPSPSSYCSVPFINSVSYQNTLVLPSNFQNAFTVPVHFPKNSQAYHPYQLPYYNPLTIAQYNSDKNFVNLQPTPSAFAPLMMPPVSIPLPCSGSSPVTPNSFSSKNFTLPMAANFNDTHTKDSFAPKEASLSNQSGKAVGTFEEKSISVTNSASSLKNSETSVLMSSRKPSLDKLSVLTNAPVQDSDSKVFSLSKCSVKLEDLESESTKILKEHAHFRDLPDETKQTFFKFISVKSAAYNESTSLFKVTLKAFESSSDSELLESCYQAIRLFLDPSIKTSKEELDKFVCFVSKSLAKSPDNSSDTISQSLVPKLCWGKPMVEIASSYHPKSAILSKYKKTTITDKKASTHGGVNFVVNAKNFTANVSNLSSLTPLIDSLETFEHKRLEKLTSLY